MSYVIFDIETDGFNPTKIHCLSMNWGGEIRSTGDYDKMRKLVTRDDITLVGHNIQLYDIPALERILEVKITCPVVDTLAVSYYLYPSRGAHGLESWGEDFGYPKVEVDESEWENMTYERAVERCSQDVIITTKLWEKQQSDLNELYEGDEKTITSLLSYLSFKMYVFRLQEENPFTLDVEKCEQNLAYLEGLKEEKTEQLKAAMPSVGVKSLRQPPAKPYKKDGSLSSTGLKWKKLTEERGLPFEHNEPIEVIKDYDEPNPNSPTQIKDWLFSLGWKPKTFTEGANGKVPQIYTQDKELCDSVKKLDSDAVEHLEGLGVLKHRIGLLKGFLRDQKDGKIYQSVAGFTSTLRIRHRYLVNLPKPSVPYGDLIRGVLTCEDGYEICGSDLASLEDRTKQHYIYPYDPEYVKTMLVENFDPHLDLAVFAGALTEEQATAHKEKKEDYGKVRHQYKTVNYAATYGIGKAKLANTLDIKQSEAKGIIDAYWKRNWSIESFTKDCKTKTALGREWVNNPINGFWYELRSKKDVFSAVNQSTGAYIFDLWVGFCLPKTKRITLQSHDEQALIVPKGHRPKVEKILREAIAKVNRLLYLNREMDIDIQWGLSYADVH